MFFVSAGKKAWQLLDRRERRGVWIVLAVILAAGIASAVMVGSVFPFLSVLSDPSRIETSKTLAGLYRTFGFNSTYSFTVALGLFALASVIVSGLLLLLRTYTVGRYSLMRIHSISRRLLKSYLGQDYEFFLMRNSGEMASQILGETEQVVRRFLLPIAEAMASLVTIVFVVIVLLFTSPTITFLALVILGGGYTVIVMLTRRTVLKLGVVRAQANKDRYSAAGEALAGIKDVKLYGREWPFLNKFSVPSELMARMIVHVRLLSQAPNNVMQMLTMGGVILLCLLVIGPTSTGEQGEIGDALAMLVMFAFAAQRLTPEMSRMYLSLTKLRASDAAVNAVLEDLLIGRKRKSWSGQSDTRITFKEILKFEGVSYTYPETDQPSLEEINLSVKAGEKVGIAGGTGAGKTTFADMILGLLLPNKGQISVDGAPIGRENLVSWRNAVSYVPQEIFLSDASIAENIAFGLHRDEIDRDKLQEAAQAAQIHDFIQNDLPHGYETNVGERGTRLSGGQRQRIGIARALYRNADLIVFDEATSALDNLTERDLMAAIETLPGSKTMIMVAHRLSTLRNCDRILLFDRGRLVQEGTWDELAQKSALFQEALKGG